MCVNCPLASASLCAGLAPDSGERGNAVPSRRGATFEQVGNLSTHADPARRDDRGVGGQADGLDQVHQRDGLLLVVDVASCPVTAGIGSLHTQAIRTQTGCGLSFGHGGHRGYHMGPSRPESRTLNGAMGRSPGLRAGTWFAVFLISVVKTSLTVKSMKEQRCLSPHLFGAPPAPSPSGALDARPM